MSFKTIKSFFQNAVSHVASHIESYTVSPDTDFTRCRKLPPHHLISFLVSQGASSTGNELLDFFDFDCSSPSLSALNQQRDKLKPEAMEAVFRSLTPSLQSLAPSPRYRLLAADGTSVSFSSSPKWAADDYFVSQGHSARGFYSIHINALYDLDSHLYTDALLQPVHFKDEFRAFCTMVDRQPDPGPTFYIYIGDRGYCSYNNMAHVMEKRQFFLFRSKDVTVRGMAGHLPVPKEGSFDTWVDITIRRSHSKKAAVSGGHTAFVDKNTAFDFLPYGSTDTYHMSVRVVRFPLKDGSYECIITNLPSDEFSADDIKRMYFARWGIETSFRRLKYTIGLSSFHSRKPEFIKQEIWAKLIVYNITESLIKSAVVETKSGAKHSYKVNFAAAAHICRIFIRLTSRKDPAHVTDLLSRHLIPIRDERSFRRLQTAHFRRPKYFLYRPS